MGDGKQPPVIVTSDSGGNRGMLIVVVILMIGIVAAILFFNLSGAGAPATDVTIDLETGEADPGTETTISP